MEGNETYATRLLERHLISIEQLQRDDMPDPWAADAAQSQTPEAAGASSPTRDWWHGRQQGWDLTQNDAWSRNGAADGWQEPQRPWGEPKDYSDPPAWPGWARYVKWKRAARRWNKNTDIPLYRR